jgi:hypothetical protein
LKHVCDHWTNSSCKRPCRPLLSPYDTHVVACFRAPFDVHEFRTAACPCTNSLYSPFETHANADVVTAVHDVHGPQRCNGCRLVPVQSLGNTSCHTTVASSLSNIEVMILLASKLSWSTIRRVTTASLAHRFRKLRSGHKEALEQWLNIPSVGERLPVRPDCNVGEHSRPNVSN